MAALLKRKDQTISIADFIRRAEKVFDALSSGKLDGFVVMNGNAPSAVVLPVVTFEAMQNELDDLRLQVLAAERMDSFDNKNAVIHAGMVARYCDKD